jgi:transposase-like protein
VAGILGIMACICNLRNVRMTSGDESHQSFHRFVCPECDKANTNSKITSLNYQENGSCETMKTTLLVLRQPLLSKLSLEEVSDRVQVGSLICMSLTCSFRILVN